jgi:hypothetical protein
VGFERFCGNSDTAHAARCRKGLNYGRRTDFRAGRRPGWDELTPVGATAFEGRAVPEKVTRPASADASAGPTPRTRSKPAREPNAPRESRSRTMRSASAGPIRGRRSISIDDARSRSTSSRGGGAGELSRREVERRGFRTVVRAPFDFVLGVARSLTRAAAAESTLRRWAASEALAGPPCVDRSPATLTIAPRNTTPARNTSARRSFEVAMGDMVPSPESECVTVSLRHGPFPRVRVRERANVSFLMRLVNANTRPVHRPYLPTSCRRHRVERLIREELCDARRQSGRRWVAHPASRR